VALLAGLVLLPAGCGLSDYSGQMANEGALVRQWEEENKLLGEPLQMPVFPKKEGKDQGTWSVFLRPPLGVNSTPVAQQGSKLTQMEGPLAKYTAKSNSFGLQYVYLGVGSDPKEFLPQVYNQFGAPAGGESSVPIPRSPVLLNGQEQDLKPELMVKRKVFDNQQSHYSFNFYERGKTIVAVGYQTAVKAAAGKEKEAAARAEPAAIQKSLSTLGEGREEVSLLRRAYVSRNQGK
jgi:hypothetical protein